MDEVLYDLAEQYKSSLQDYLSGAGEAALHRAYVIGRRAIAEGLGVLQMAALHQTSAAEILSGAATPEEGTAMALRAADFFAESLSPFEMALRWFQESNAALRWKIKSLEKQLTHYAEPDSIIPTNQRMLRIKEIAVQAANTDVPVLILGESGVGKEVMARFIHNQSGRRNKPFIKVNCAALPHDLLESELFGYERGAFTGALSAKPGKFELADKGTMLLDEIAEMGPQLQAKLLHVLQDGEYCRLGGKHQIRVDTRIIATTNRRPEEEISRGRFREDLYYRLDVIRLEIPPLRERKEDIPLLCSYFFQKYREKYKSSIRQLPRQLLEIFLSYDWPGNIRELESAIKRFLILRDFNLELSVMKKPCLQGAILPARNLTLRQISLQAAERAEREAVLRVLAETRWNRKQAALRLNICYKALLNRLKKWQIDRPHSMDENRG